MVQAGKAHGQSKSIKGPRSTSVFFCPLVIVIIREVDTTSLKPKERRKNTTTTVAFANVFMAKNRKRMLSPRA